MTAETNKKNLAGKREKRARSIAAMGLVNRVEDKFHVSTPSLRGRQATYAVWRDASGRIRCNCLEFEEAAAAEPKFRCEHILAVKYALIDQNTESAAKKQPVRMETQIEVKAAPVESTEKIATEPERSESGVQKPDTATENAPADGPVRAEKFREPDRLATKKGVKKMNQENVKNRPLEPADQETADNVLNFTSTLRELRQNVDPHLVKQREGWRDRNGRVQMVDYVEWHTVADILDETAPNWTHTIRNIQQIGDIMTVTVAISIDGITREGIGTGAAFSEMGIKKAEHDALKRAAVKFGIARDLYKKESDTIEREGALPLESDDDGGNGNEFPANPIARSLSDLVTAKQLGMIRAISRELGIDADEECHQVMNCRTDELSKRAASSLIQHLQDLQKNQTGDINVPLRRAG